MPKAVATIHFWLQEPDLNRQPFHYESSALPNYTILRDCGLKFYAFELPAVHQIKRRSLPSAVQSALSTSMVLLNPWTITTLVAAAASFGAGALIQDAHLGQSINLTSSKCDIKGNVSIETGERIYHLPGQKYYSDTKVSSDYGERWFCSEQQAITAGWRRSKI